MFRPINIDTATELIKNIVDNNRCAVCDRSNGIRMRYACGHTSCDDCVSTAVDCSVCLSPQADPREPVADKPFTQRAEHSVELLHVFENEFHIDVYKRHRISEQLKIEKEVFPECIQAPAKYYNKRKSFRNSKSNKEYKLSQLPGEAISPVWSDKMEHSSEIVEHWLKKHARKPFADINTNDDRSRRRSRTFKAQKYATDIENIPVQKATRKRAHTKTASSIVKSQLINDKHLTPMKKIQHTDNNSKRSKIENKLCTTLDISKKSNEKVDEDESGIVLDDEAIIVIDDTQSVRIDKDVEALLAVQEAEKNEQFVSASIISPKSNEVLSHDYFKNAVKHNVGFTTRVPFYLRSYLSLNCIDCNEIKPKSEHQASESTKDVSITIANKSFTTIIKVTNVEETNNKVKSKQSVEVQTDIVTESLPGNEEIVNSVQEIKWSDHDEEISPIACNLLTSDLFKDAGVVLESTVNNKSPSRIENKAQNVIIEESDSDEDLEESISVSVEAVIHRSCEETDNGILTDVENVGEHSKRPRRAARGLTPTSTDSSEKENFNPNRRKKAVQSKKKPLKK